jgi:hypothetical protein
MRRPFILGSTLALSLGLVACNQSSPPVPAVTASDDVANFRRCVDSEAKAAFQRSTQIYGYHTDVENEIIAICDPHLSPERVLDSAYTTNTFYKYVNAAVTTLADAALDERVRDEIAAQHKQEALDAPKLKAEKDEEAAAGVDYYRCLVRHAHVLALNTNEPAEVIAKASFPSCSDERQALVDVYRRHDKSYMVESIDLADEKFQQGLLLEIIKARAQPSPSPEPAKPGEPI